MQEISQLLKLKESLLNKQIRILESGSVIDATLKDIEYLDGVLCLYFIFDGTENDVELVDCEIVFGPILIQILGQYLSVEIVRS